MKYNKKLALATLSLSVAIPSIVIPLTIDNAHAETKIENKNEGWVTYKPGVIDENKTELTQEVAIATVDKSTSSTSTNNKNITNAGSYFKDVTSNYAYYDIINDMVDKGIINGYGDGTFRPNETLSRQHAAALINRAVQLPKIKQFKAPKDLTTKSYYYKDIKALMEAGLLEVDKNGKINPAQPLTRGEMAKIIATAYQLDMKGSHPLKDVSSKYSKYVSALYNADITTGFEDKTFKENQSLTRAHYAVFMYRAEENKSKENDKFISDAQSLTDEEFKKLSAEQIAKLVKPYSLSESNKIPLPKGKTDREALTKSLEIQYSQYVNENGRSAIVKASIDKDLTFTAHQQFTEYYPKILKCSGIDAVKIINRAYTTGELITNENAGIDTDGIFALYFDYLDGTLNISYLN